MTHVTLEFHWMRQSCTDTNTVSKQKEAIFQMTHVTLELSVSKTISEPMVRSTQTVLLSCVNISIEYVQNNF